jgi:hypothetical protein
MIRSAELARRRPQQTPCAHREIRCEVAVPDQSPPDDIDDAWWAEAEQRALRAHRRRRWRRALGRATRPGPRQPGRARTGRRVVVALLALGLVAGALWWQRDRLSRPVTGDVAATARPTRTVGGTVDRGPFAGTPAATWRSGAAGVATPVGARAGVWSADEVGGWLSKVRDLLVAGHLDPDVTVRHHTARVLDALAPDDRRQEHLTYVGAVVRLASDAPLSAAAPRVRGTTTYRAVTADGRPTLRIVTNYVWAYAFADARHPVVVHDNVTWEIHRGDTLAASSRGLWISRSAGYVVGVDCARTRSGVIAPPPATDRDVRPNPSATEDPDALYRPDHPMDIADTCRH